MRRQVARSVSVVGARSERVGGRSRKPARAKKGIKGLDNRNDHFHLNSLTSSSLSFTKIPFGYASFMLHHCSFYIFRLKHPCLKGSCVPPYGFQNHLPLTSETKLFAKKVAETLVTGHTGTSNGGFDAIMQTVVCQEEIKWRKNARHFVIIVTNATSHIAGDGKLAGVVEPNDEQCHVENNLYTDGLIYDYPSIFQINKQAKKHAVSLIFAVVKELDKMDHYNMNIDHYQHLVAGMEDVDLTVLNNHSANLIDQILKSYQKQIETVKITDNSKESGISISYRSRCIQDTWSETNICEGVDAGINITFEVSIKVPSCHPREIDVWKETITFTPNGLNEITQIDLQIICGCSCDFEGNSGFESNSSSCTYNGDKKCGTCYCYDTYTGPICQCDKNQVTMMESVEACISNNISGALCNDRGSCVCNVCNCFKRQNPNEVVSGALCECDNFSCLRSPDNEVCGGPERGQCYCGQCNCRMGWSGEDCTCADGPHVCRAPGDNQQCSGAGSCECGTCSCEKGYKGQFCEDCLNCVGGRCLALGACVEHLVHKSGKYDEEFCNSQNIVLQKIVKEKIIVREINPEEGHLHCKMPDDAGCSFVFTYEVKEGQILIIAEENKECPSLINLFAIIFGVIGGTFLIGLISIITWKFLTTIHDRREYAKFENERLKSKWQRGENPLYKQATSTYNNPTYKQEN